MRLLYFAAALVLLMGASMAAAQVEFPDEGPEILPDLPNREEVFNRCTACHSTAIIRRTRLDRARWDDLMDWMTEKQGMPALEGDERVQIVDYLAAAFRPAAGRARAANPFAED